MYKYFTIHEKTILKGNICEIFKIYDTYDFNEDNKTTINSPKKLRNPSLEKLKKYVII